jgi:Phage gp6-like head-tail connector protein
MADPILVTLETAKLHLRITDLDHDADVTLKMTQASETIRRFLDLGNDPLWTSEDVPAEVQAAVLLRLAHLYEHRGDEFGSGNDNDEKNWAAITNCLRHLRDPVVA